MKQMYQKQNGLFLCFCSIFFQIIDLQVFIMLLFQVANLKTIDTGFYFEGN